MSTAYTYSSDYPKTTKRILTPDEARLREIFAAAALPECYREACKEFDGTGVPENWRIGVAMDAYAMADAMLAARVSSLTKEAKGVVSEQQAEIKQHKEQKQ